MPEIAWKKTTSTIPYTPNFLVDKQIIRKKELLRLKSGKYDIPKEYHEIPELQIELDFIAECKNY